MVTRGDSDIRLSPQALLMLLAAIAGSNVVQGFYTQSRTAPEAVRPDPFTGEMGRAEAARREAADAALESRIEDAERVIDSLKRDLQDCLGRSK